MLLENFFRQVLELITEQTRIQIIRLLLSKNVFNYSNIIRKRFVKRVPRIQTEREYDDDGIHYYIFVGALAPYGYKCS